MSAALGNHRYEGRHRAERVTSHRIPLALAAVAAGVVTTTVGSQMAASALQGAAPRTTSAPVQQHTPKLVKGAHGVSVRYLQARLGLHATGTFGWSTVRAVKAFQAKAGVPVTGVADSATWRALPALKVVRASRAATRTSIDDDGLNWAALAKCESGGNPHAYNAAGYYGLYQFSLGTWHGVGGSGSPSEASADEQTYRAQLLYKSRGRSPWPVCGRYL